MVEMTMMRLRSLTFAFVAALTLGACQTTASNISSTHADLKLTRAGFTKIDTPAGIPQLSGARITGTYICMKEQCGELVVVLTAAIDQVGPPMPPLTYENAVRSGAYNDDGVRRLFQQLFDSQSEQAAKVEHLRIDRHNAVITMRALMGSGEKQARAVLSIRVRGDSGAAIVAISKNAATSTRYAKTHYLD